ncbi:Hexosyltransferase [Caligus rogercresseyi]|uniref:Hexosyltransferase n=1 Tax=Caligus rogercresseyi TaxID=217165 RepID=A0A7T8QVS3_CALRO|nr:Hexosyltransferase [Caligus rogercresseyi]
MDDDIMVRMDRVRKELPYIFEDDQYALAGYVQSNLKPSRDPKSKWFSSYPESFYPDFLSGWAYIATQASVQALASSLLKEKQSIFWIDDVWITGMIGREHLGLRLKSLNRFFAEYRDYVDQCCFIDTSLECMYWVGPSEGKIEAIEAFGKQCTSRRDLCSRDSIVSKEPRRLRDCSSGPCLREVSPDSNKMSCLAKYANPFDFHTQKVLDKSFLFEFGG